MSIQHKDIPEAQLHETKGASTSTTGQILTSTGGAATFQAPAAVSGQMSQGVYDYNDLGTTASPIALIVAGQQYPLTNDGAGTNTNTTYALPGISNMWNVATNSFDFTGLNLGDTVDIRFDVEYTTGTNDTDIFLVLELGVGGSPYQLTLVGDAGKKSSGLHKILEWNSVYMGDTNTLNNPARLLASADKTNTTVVVNGWYIRPLHTAV